MHPNPAFSWNDRAEMLDFVAEQSFAHIFAASDAGRFVVLAPVIVRDGSILFHVSRRNRIASHLGGGRVLISVLGRHAYQSANWYASEDQVPTWHYEAVEIEGIAREISEEELVSLIDQLSDTMEQRYSPERPWKRSELSPDKFEALLKAIVGFEVQPTEFGALASSTRPRAGKIWRRRSRDSETWAGKTSSPRSKS